MTDIVGTVMKPIIDQLNEMHKHAGAQADEPRYTLSDVTWEERRELKEAMEVLEKLYYKLAPIDRNWQDEVKNMLIEAGEKYDEISGEEEQGDDEEDDWWVAWELEHKNPPRLTHWECRD